VTSRELIRWSRLHERRAVRWRPLIAAIAIACMFAGFVAWRHTANAIAASHAWLAGTLVAFAFAFLRVPFLMYWRADASLLAQLPIEGAPLFDAALWRCLAAAATTTAICVVAAIPIGLDLDLALRHVALAGALGLAAGCLLPAVVVWSASLVATNQDATAARTIHLATALATGSARRAMSRAPVAASTTLGAVPGFAATAIIVPVLIVSPWLVGAPTKASPALVLGGIAALSLGGIALARATCGRIMATILRDVSALDRQRLATLEIRAATPIERAIGRLLGDGALAYDKTARLVRRRYPMAFALGALAFLVLAITGLARPADPAPWLAATLASAAAYAVSLAGRLDRPPIELPRLAASLPISPAARARARRAWLVGWWTIFVLAPGLFAALRTDPAVGLALLGAGTLLVLVI
jgi:hypothetical protein